MQRTEGIVLVASCVLTFNGHFASVQDFVHFYSTCKTLRDKLSDDQNLWKIYYFKYFSHKPNSLEQSWKQNFQQTFINRLPNNIRQGTYWTKHFMLNENLVWVDRIHLGCNYLSFLGNRTKKENHQTKYSSLIAINLFDLSPLEKSEGLRRVESSTSSHLFVRSTQKVEIFNEKTKETEASAVNPFFTGGPKSLISMINGEKIDNDLLLSCFKFKTKLIEDVPELNQPGVELLSMEGNIAIFKTAPSLFSVEISPEKSAIMKKVAVPSDVKFIYSGQKNRIFISVWSSLFFWDGKDDVLKSFNIGPFEVSDKAHMLMNDQYIVLGDLLGRVLVFDSSASHKFLCKFNLKKPGSKIVGCLQMAFFQEDLLVTQNSRSITLRNLKKGGEELYSINLGAGLKPSIVSNGYSLACFGNNSVYVVDFLHPNDPSKQVPENMVDTYSVTYSAHGKSPLNPFNEAVSTDDDTDKEVENPIVEIVVENKQEKSPPSRPPWPCINLEEDEPKEAPTVVIPQRSAKELFIENSSKLLGEIFQQAKTSGLSLEDVVRFWTFGEFPKQ